MKLPSMPVLSCGYNHRALPCTNHFPRKHRTEFEMPHSGLEEKTGQLFIYLFFNSGKHTLQDCKASGQTQEQELNLRITERENALQLNVLR